MSSNEPAADTKYHILIGIYVGAWGLVPGLTPKLIPLDLTWAGVGVLSVSFGAFIHAITFPCTDAVAEVWGAVRARRMVFVGFSFYCVAIAFYLLGTLLPPAPGWMLNDAFVGLYGSAWRLILASLTATVCAQLLDIYVFERIKRLTGQRWLWLRNNASTAISQLVDTLIFYSIAFYGVIPNDQLPLLVLGTYLVKLVITVVDTPVVYLLVRWISGHWTARGDVPDPAAEQG